MIGRLIVMRLAQAVLTLFAVAFVVFAGTELLPGDVAEALLGQSATPETLAALRQKLGLDEPAILRFFGWVGGLFVGDLGTSLANGRPVADLLSVRLGETLLLAAAAAAISVPLALTLGILAATRPGKALDRTISGAAVVTVSAPEFLIATLLVLVFAVELRWLPALSRPDGGGFLEWAQDLALPVATLSMMVLAPMTRMTRSALLGVLSSSFMEMAVLKGLPRWRLILVHALPNAMAPIANVVALNLAYMVSGVVIVEVVFGYPGMAKLMVDSVSGRDLPTVQTCALFFCAVYVSVNLLADLVAMLSNPRLRRPR